MHPYAQIHLDDIRDLQDDVRAQPNKKAALDHLAEHYPHCTRAFLNRNLAHLVAIDPEELVRILGHPDPTGEEATMRALRSTT